MESKLPISAIVVTSNEEARLSECLRSLRFCAEVIVCDLESEDRSVAIAENERCKVVHRKREPIVELVVPSLISLAKYNWVLRLDPDEEIDVTLVPYIDRLFPCPPPDVAAYDLPWQFYFLKRMLKGTPWGGRNSKTFLMHRDRVIFEGYVHRGVKALDGFRKVSVATDGSAVIHHYWMTSFGQLFKKHRRYVQAEGQSQYDAGDRFTWLYALRQVFRAAWKAFVVTRSHRDGWRGLFLALFFVWYQGRSLLSLRRVQRSMQQVNDT